MIVKITNDARIKDYLSILGNTVTIVSGYDEKFSLDDPQSSIVEKTMKAGKGYIIEDTTLTIDGKTYSSAVSRMDVSGLERAVWTTKMAYHSGSVIHFFKASLSGHIKGDLSDEKGPLSFGEIFIPDGYERNICELEGGDDTDFKNARQLALTKLLLGKSYYVKILEPTGRTGTAADIQMESSAFN